ncbi:MAG: hypothetical protein OEM52_02900 [bacterium]|nr:hypothetical protein [bacterium]
MGYETLPSKEPESKSGQGFQGMNANGKKSNRSPGLNIAIPQSMANAYAVLVDPAVWGEHFLKNPDGDRRQYWPHQYQDLRSTEKQIIHQDGREVGKTIVLTTLVLHYGFTTRNGSGLVATPHQGHLETIIDEVEQQIFNNPTLLKSVAKNRYGNPDISQKPYYRIRFSTGTVIHFRQAGDSGQPFRSLHVERVWVDEAAWMTERAWKALRRCLNEGGVFRIYSTPNGLRDTTYYRLTQDKTKRWQVMRWPSSLHPNWTAAREKELLEFYGGRETSGFQHEVLGEHGSPTYSAFPVESVKAALVEIPEYQRIVLTNSELADCENESAIRTRLDLLLGLTPRKGKFWLGGDLGYTSDPCELLVWQEEEGNKLALVMRVHTEQVAYPVIAELLAVMDDYFQFAGLGVDEGGNGLAVVQELSTLDKFAEYRFSDRLIGFNFGSSTVIGYTDEGKQRKKRTKELMTSLINGRLSQKTIRFPNDDVEVEDQFCTHTYVMSEGKIVYSKGRDHIIDATRCAMLRVYLEEIKELRPEIEEAFIMPVTTDPVFV